MFLTGAKRCLQCNQCWAALAVWVQCELSTPWHDSSEVNRTCLLGPLCNSSCKGATCSMQVGNSKAPFLIATTPSCRGGRYSFPRIVSCSRILSLAPNSSASEPPTSTSWVDPQEDPKWSPLLVPNTVPFEAEKGHWTQECCKAPYGICRQMVFHCSADIDIQPWGLTWDEEKYRSPFASTPCPMTRICPSKPSFQRTSGSPDQAYLDHHYTDVDEQNSLWIISLWPLQNILERDHWSASQWFLDRGSTDYW